MNKKLWSVLVILTVAAATPAPAEDPADPYSWFAPEHADVQLLILGTFHFKDAGLDSYKPQVDIDILSPQRQAELAEVLDRLAAFKPTKILLEWKVDRQPVADERYQDYLKGEFELGANEVYQIGFRLAKRLGHAKLFNVDVFGRAYEDLPESLEEYAKEKGQEHLLSNPWGARFAALYEAEDRAKAGRSLRQTLLAMNRPEAIDRLHGHYVLRRLALGDADEYPAADHLTGWWYNRNLRIFCNVLRAVEPGDRALLVIGAGHGSILRHAAQASPEIALVEVADVLAD